MRQVSMRLLPFTALVLTIAAANACSLINAPDDVKPQGSAGSSSTGGSNSEGGKGNTDAGGEAATANEGGTEPGVGGDAAGGEPGVIDQDPGPGPNPTTGMLVLGAKDDKNVRYLTVVNGRTGKELLSEKLPVAAVAYDEAQGRHLWFVFTAGAYPASPTGAADLEVRRFDDTSGRWFVIGRASALPPPEPDQLVMLNERLVYLSHRVVSGKPVSALTVLDTSKPTDVKVLTTRTAEAGEEFVGVTGDRGSDVNPDAPGGRLRAMIRANCTTDCDLVAQQIFVSDDLTDGTSVTLDRFVGTPRFAKPRSTDVLFVAVRSTKPSSRVVVRSFTGPDLTSPTLSTITGFVGDDVGGFALLECAEGGTVTDVDGKQLFALQLATGNLQPPQPLTNAGAQVYSEPYGPSVIALDNTMAPGTRSFEVSRSGTMNVAVNERTIWQPNGKLVPLTGATRRTEAFKCP